MNRDYMEVNRTIGRGIGSEALKQALIAAQLNNRRTFIDPAKVDVDRGREIISMLAVKDDVLGTVIRPVPYDAIRDDTPATLNLVMQALCLYTFPTEELVGWLKGQIDDDPELEPHTAIEICAGTGWLGRSLGIPVTDSRMQEREDVMEIYRSQGAVPILYPRAVEKLGAVAAVRKYSPEYVIASYCTCLYGTAGPRHGSSLGVDTRWVRSHCRRFYHIGNDDIHRRDPIMKVPHERLSFDWLVTRGDSGKARIYVWENRNY